MEHSKLKSIYQDEVTTITPSFLSRQPVLEIENEFDNYDNYNLNLRLIKKYSARRRKMEAKMQMR